MLPALVLNYFGQGALLLTDPTALRNPFYELAPNWAHYPLVLLATAATVIASQAVITGAFSLTQQAIQLGLLPRLRVIQTAGEEKGQIYIPFINWGLAVLTLGAVLGFGSSSKLAGAYGLAVSLDMVITTILATFVALHWGHRPVLVYLLNGSLLLVDLMFFAANTTKLFEGGWLPLLIASTVAFVMLTWRRGQQLLKDARSHLRVSTDEFLERLNANPPIRVPGTAIVLASSPKGVPRSLLHHLKHNRVLHERLIIVSVIVTDEPHVPETTTHGWSRSAKASSGSSCASGSQRAERPRGAPRGSDPVPNPRTRSGDPDLLRRPPDCGADPGSTRHGILAGDRVFHAQSELRTDRGLFLHSSVPGHRGIGSTIEI